jgi:hypothetical protein
LVYYLLRLFSVRGAEDKDADAFSSLRLAEFLLLPLLSIRDTETLFLVLAGHTTLRGIQLRRYPRARREIGQLQGARRLLLLSFRSKNGYPALSSGTRGVSHPSIKRATTCCFCRFCIACTTTLVRFVSPAVQFISIILTGTIIGVVDSDVYNGCCEVLITINLS